METTALAMYIDLENLPKGVDFDLLMEQAASDTAKHVYAVKAAYGSAVALPRQYRQQLLDHNFQIVDTPHIAKKKNRADLIISIDAFERLHLNRPSIDRYVFVTSDSDFSVVMDKLRIYGKQVWMICHKADQAKKIHQGFDFKSTRFKRLTDLTVHFENAGVVRLGTNAKGLTQIEDVDDARLEDDEVSVGVAAAAVR